MPVSADTLRLLIASGLSGDALVEVVASIDRDMAAAAPAAPVVDEQAERRRAADRARKAAARSAVSAECPRNVRGSSAEAPPSSPSSSSPPTPPLITTTPSSTPSPSLRSGEARPKRERSKARTQIAPDAMPTPADVEAAKRAGFDKATMQREWPRFRDHHRAKGSLMADWGAAWRTWLGNVGRFQPARGSPAPGPGRRTDPWMLAAESLIAEMTVGTDCKPPEPDPYAGPVLDLRPAGVDPSGADRRVDVDAQIPLGEGW